MPATCHRVVGIVDVEENPDFLLQFEGPLQSTGFESPEHHKYFTASHMTAEIQQLAADLKIEYERYQRLQLVGSA